MLLRVTDSPAFLRLHWRHVMPRHAVWHEAALPAVPVAALAMGSTEAHMMTRGSFAGT